MWCLCTAAPGSLLEPVPQGQVAGHGAGAGAALPAAVWRAVCCAGVTWGPGLCFRGTGTLSWGLSLYHSSSEGHGVSDAGAGGGQEAG